MKATRLLVLGMFLLFATTAYSQLVADYSFTQLSGTYTEISGGTVLGTTSNDDNNWNAIPIGFTFKFNQVNYDTISVQTNGFIRFATSVASSYSAISTSTAGIDKLVAGFNRDIESRTDGELSYQVNGSVGSRILTVQWKNYQRYTTGATDNGDIFNFQIQLFETSNKIEIVYGSYTINTGNTVQVGLKGASNADFNNRSVIDGSNTWATSTAGGANTATCQFTTAGLNPASGQIYRYTPPTISANDIKGQSLDDPASGGAKPENTAFSPKATFKNVGTSTQGPFNVRYQIYNSVPTQVYSNTQSVSSLLPDSLIQVTFGSVVGGLPAGAYTIRAMSLLAGDANTANDTVNGTMTALLVISSYPYSEDFEGAEPASAIPASVTKTPTSFIGAADVMALPESKRQQYLADGYEPTKDGGLVLVDKTPGGISYSPNEVMTGGLGWTTAILSGAVNDWVRGTPAKTQIAGAHGGTKCYVTKTTGTYSVSHNAYIQSPILNFTSLGVDPTLRFWHNFQGETGSFYGYDCGFVEYSIDGGATWRRVDSVLGTGGNFETANSFNWYNSASTNNSTIGAPPKYSNIVGSTGSTGYTGHSSGWIESATVLTGTAGASDVRIRWRWGTDGVDVAEGWAIDDVSITTALANDVRPMTFDDPLNGGTKTAGVAFSPKASFKNVGTATQGPFNVKYEIYNSVPASVYSDIQSIASLTSGTTLQVTFASVAGGLAAGAYTIRTISLLSPDGNTTNDTINGTLTVLPAGTVLYEPFDSFLPAGWTRTGTTIWKGGTAVQSNGSSGGTTFADFFSVSSGTDTLKSPIVDISALAAVALPKLLKFDHAYRTYTGGESDTVRLLISSDGGVSWTATLFYDGAPTMATLEPSSSELIPSSASDWRNNVLAIPGPYLVSTFRMAFLAKTDFGNNFYLDNVFIVVQPDTDLVMESVSQPNGIPDPFRPSVRTGVKKEAGLTMVNRGRGAAASPEVNRTRLLPGLGINADVRLKASVNNSPEAIVPVTLRSVVRNYGVDSPSYVVNWTFDGVSQTPVARGGFSSFGADSVDLSLTPTARGTFSAFATATVSNDADGGNNSKTYHRTLVYPDSSIRIKYDNGSNIPDDRIGFNGPDLEAGVRFTASQDIKLANIDAYYLNASSGDSVTVKVYAAGGNDTTPGSLLYSKKFGGPNYTSTTGGYFTLPLGNDAPTIASGSDFWVSILFPPTPFPMGAHSSGFTAGRSFISADSGATWALLDLPPEWAWLLRVVGVSGGSGATVSVTVKDGWDLISNPVITPNDSVKQLFPASLFNYAFSFGAGGYSQQHRLLNGVGYWAKFPDTTVQIINGSVNVLDTVPVVGGWNIVGSISSIIDTGQVQDPGGIRTSAYFGWNGIYTNPTDITPGEGYWVKVSSAGILIFSTAPAPAGRPRTENVLEALSRITITDKSGISQELYFGAERQDLNTAMYAMPPLPPSGAFDARFETADGGSKVQTYQSDAAVSMPIALQTDGPVTVSWTIADGSVYELSDAVGRQVKVMQGSGSATFNSAKLIVKTTSLEGLPREYALFQNYPNPFNPSTNVKFALPVESKVNIEIFNILGQRMRTLLSDNLTAGYHIVEWNGKNDAGSQLSTGVYLLKISATSTQGRQFSDVQKLMLVK